MHAHIAIGVSKEEKSNILLIMQIKLALKLWAIDRTLIVEYKYLHSLQIIKCAVLIDYDN